MKKFNLILMFFVALSFFNINAQTYSGGSGTSGDPYLIANLTDLQYLSEHDADWTKHFKQTADIDASATSGWNSGQGFKPIGIDMNEFTGSYNGQGYKIQNLTIN